MLRLFASAACRHAGEVLKLVMIYLAVVTMNQKILERKGMMLTMLRPKLLLLESAARRHAGEVLKEVIRYLAVVTITQMICKRKFLMLTTKLQRLYGSLHAVHALRSFDMDIGSSIFIQFSTDFLNVVDNTD